MAMTAAAIAAELRAVPVEVERASRTARLKAGRRARAETVRRLKGKVQKPKERVKGKRDTLWLGANPVAADHVPGAVTSEKRGPYGQRVMFLGESLRDGFRFNPYTKSSVGDWSGADFITVQRLESRWGSPFVRYMVPFDDEAAAAFDSVADEAGDMFLDEFDKEIRRIVGAA